MLLRRCRPDKMTLGPGGVCSGRREGAAGWQGTKSGWCPAGRLQLVALPTPQRPICARALFRLRLTRSSSRPLNACAGASPLEIPRSSSITTQPVFSPRTASMSESNNDPSATPSLSHDPPSLPASPVGLLGVHLQLKMRVRIWMGATSLNAGFWQSHGSASSSVSRVLLDRNSGTQGLPCASRLSSASCY